MLVSIKSPEFKLILPVPISLGGIIIRFIPKKYINSEEKKIALRLFKSLKYSLKSYKGLKIVEIVSKNGEYISITI